MNELGATRASDFIEQYGEDGQTWWMTVMKLTSDGVWEQLSEEVKAQPSMARMRAEYELYRNMEDKVLPITPDGKGFPAAYFDPKGFGLRKIDSKLISSKWLSAYQKGDANFNILQLSSTRAYRSLAIDLTKRAGEKLKNEWLLTVTNDSYEMMVGICFDVTYYFINLHGTCFHTAN